MQGNHLCEMPGIERPILQAPMGWIARSQLASAVSNAGGLGIIETSSSELDSVRPVKDILASIMAEYRETVAALPA